MRSTLSDLLASQPVLLADGATGTNYMNSGLGPGEAPELWNVDTPDQVAKLHQAFVDAGADIILTNTFGCNARRLMLHGNQHRVAELASAAARIARRVADAAPRPVVVAGSVGPTGDLFEPLGAMTHDLAVEVFREQIAALVDGGADVAWIETMSAVDEVRAAAQAAIEVGVPYVATCSFDTAGRTMMGLLPSELPSVFDGLAVAPLAIGANCGVGAPDILVSLLGFAGGEIPAVCKGNCGVPQFVGTDVVYTGTPELMARYAALAVDAGARIVGGCCGTSREHLAAMRVAIDHHVRGPVPDVARIVTEVGELVNAAPSSERAERPRRRSR